MKNFRLVDKVEVNQIYFLYKRKNHYKPVKIIDKGFSFMGRFLYPCVDPNHNFNLMLIRKDNLYELAPSKPINWI